MGQVYEPSLWAKSGKRSVPNKSIRGVGLIVQLQYEASSVEVGGAVSAVK
jgi:hypothetical protein